MYRVRKFRFWPQHHKLESSEDLSDTPKKVAIPMLCSPQTSCSDRNQQSSWTCDGEILRHAAITVRWASCQDFFPMLVSGTTGLRMCPVLQAHSHYQLDWTIRKQLEEDGNLYLSRWEMRTRRTFQSRCRTEKESFCTWPATACEGRQCVWAGST